MSAPDDDPATGLADRIARHASMKVSDFVVTPAVVLGTDDRRDDVRNDERCRNAEEDERAAQRQGVVEGAEPQAPAAAGNVDASIEEARDRAAGGADVPILLRDPVTGAPIGSV